MDYILEHVLPEVWAEDARGDLFVRNLGIAFNKQQRNYPQLEQAEDAWKIMIWQFLLVSC